MEEAASSTQTKTPVTAVAASQDIAGTDVKSNQRGRLEGLLEDLLEDPPHEQHQVQLAEESPHQERHNPLLHPGPQEMDSE